MWQILVFSLLNLFFMSVFSRSSLYDNIKFYHQQNPVDLRQSLAFFDVKKESMTPVPNLYMLNEEINSRTKEKYV